MATANPPVVNVHADLRAWAHAAAAEIAAWLRAELKDSAHARLLLSGGTTPGPVYEALSAARLAWSRIDVALVDERWLPPGSADTNARLVQRSLLADAAAAAHFEPLLTANRTLEESVWAANHSSRPATVAVLGMGPDGHIASLFPAMHGFDEVLQSTDDYVAVDADGCPGAGAWRRRISLTPAGLARATHRLLLIRGEDKRILLRRAMAGDDPRELPVRLAFDGSPLVVHWCP